MHLADDVVKFDSKYYHHMQNSFITVSIVEPIYRLRPEKYLLAGFSII